MASKKQYTYSSLSKLINFNENQLIKINNIDVPKKDIIIISFLGPARIGKSTLLNCFLSFILNENIQSFKCSSSSKSHCTSGVDMVYLESDTKTIILLDVQGLDFQDSSNDCKLMLFVYMISNIIIYNERGFLTNKVLSSLQSLTCLLTFIDKNNDFNKPELIFRTSDIDDESDFDSIENLNDLLSDTKHDQYTNTRKSIKKLFSNIKSFHTFTLDRDVKRIIDKENNYFKFLDQENNFKDFCSKIFNIIDTKSNNSVINNIDTIIEQINSNQNIDFKIFDLTYSQALLSILEWKESKQFESILIMPVIDGTQENYDENIQPIIDNYRDIMNEYDMNFKLTTPKIKLEQEQEIRSKFDNFINECKKISKSKSDEIMTQFFNDCKETKIATTIVSELFRCQCGGYGESSRRSRTRPMCKGHETITYIPNPNYIKSKKITLISYCDIVKQIDSEYDVLYTKIKNVKCLTRTINDSIRFIEKIKYKILNKILREYNEFLKMQEEQINRNIQNMNIYIDEESYKLIIYAKIIDTSFDTLIQMILDSLNKIIIDAWNGIYIDITYNLLNENITIETGPKYDLLFYILTEINNKDLMKNIFKYELTDKENLISEIKKYFYTQYQEQFELERKKILVSELKEIQKTNICVLVNFSNIKTVQDNYKITKELCDKLIQAGNKVQFLDIFEIIQPFISNNIAHSGSSILRRYIFLVNEYKIHEILTESDFNIKYKDVIAFYNNKYKHDRDINYECICHLINALFTINIK